MLPASCYTATIQLLRLIGVPPIWAADHNRTTQRAQSLTQTLPYAHCAAPPTKATPPALRWRCNKPATMHSSAGAPAAAGGAGSAVLLPKPPKTRSALKEHQVTRVGADCWCQPGRDARCRPSCNPRRIAPSHAAGLAAAARAPRAAPRRSTAAGAARSAQCRRRAESSPRPPWRTAAPPA